jgi:hypothetical protein
MGMFEVLLADSRKSQAIQESDIHGGQAKRMSSKRQASELTFHLRPALVEFVGMDKPGT